MEIKVSSGDIVNQTADVILVNLFEGVTVLSGAVGIVNMALSDAISKLISSGEITGKEGEITCIHTLGLMIPDRVVVIGLGKQNNLDVDKIRSVVGATCRYVRRLGVESIATIAHGAGIGDIDAHASAQAIAEGALLGLYEFDKYISNDKCKKNVTELVIVEADLGELDSLRNGVSDGCIMGDAVNTCRDMASEPANFMTPTQLSETALKIAKDDEIDIEVLEESKAREMGMGAFLGVSQGSEEPLKFIVMQYMGDSENESNHIALIGKGITFDSGGISIKPASNMGAMKGDMAGGAAVISAMSAVGKFKPRINVTAIVPATENMPGGKAQRPGDVVRTMNGKTIEVDNTDAEGRLVLADALSYARQLGLTRIVDVATLTGAMLVALGDVYTGLFGNDEELISEVLKAGKDVGEKIWHMPVHDKYKEQYKSSVADIKNTGGRAAGSITGALIIGEFADGASWVHLDIAGTARSDRSEGYIPKGATGIPVRTLVQLVLNLADCPLEIEQF